MKIPFDVKYRPEIESGKYRVETREGKSVRIICWDGNIKDCPIVGFIASHDYVRYWHNTGIIKEDYGCNNKDDIFIITDEVNLTEFELALLNIVNSFEGKKMHPEGAKAFSKELLSIAMKDVPKWSKDNNNLNSGCYGLERRGFSNLHLCTKHWKISIDDLHKLPKEE